MSLVAWYPLIDGFKNQGIVDADPNITTQPTLVSDGPLGSCVSTGAFSWTAAQTAKIFNNKTISFAFWIKPTLATGTSGSWRLFNNEENTSVTPNLRRDFTIFLYPTVNDLHCAWANMGGGSWTGAIPSNTWTHVAITYDNPTATVYINGNVYGTFTGDCTTTDFATTTTVFNSFSDIQRCDYRVYDHCLSVKEVKELAKALSMHLPLKGLPTNPNLYYNSETMPLGGADGTFTRTNLSSEDDGVYTRITCTAAGYGPYFYGLGFNGRRYNGSQLTWSCYMRASKATTKAVGHESGGRTNFALTTEWQKLTYTWTSSGGGAFTIYNDWAVGDWVDIKNLKFEENSEATSWVPNVYDSEYSSLNYGTLAVPYTIVGSPTNYQGDLNNFSSSNYINTGYTLNTGSSTWEVTTRLTTGSDVVTRQHIQGCLSTSGSLGVLFGIYSSQACLWLSNSGTSFDIQDQLRAVNVSASTTYWFKYGWDGTNYYIKRSTDGGVTYTTDITLTSSSTIHSTAFYAGAAYDKSYPFLGYLDMNKFTITVNKNLVYTGCPIQGNKYITSEISGYNRQVTLAGRVTPVSSTPKGMGVNFISGGKLSVTSGFPVGSQIPFTIAMWHKPTDNTYTAWTDICGTDVGTSSSTSYGGFFRLENVDATGTSYKWFGNGYVASSAGLCANTAEIGTWRHVALTFDGTTFTQYIDGAQTATHTLESTYAGFKTYGKFYVGDIFMDAADCRVYGTCLSAGDVKALSTTPISIGKNGNLYCGDLVEADSIKCRKTGEFDCIPDEGDYDKASFHKDVTVTTPEFNEV